MGEIEERLLLAMNEAEAKAWQALAGYKFLMFGYHASAWVKYNHLLTEKKPNPFKEIVTLAGGLLWKYPKEK